MPSSDSARVETTTEAAKMKTSFNITSCVCPAQEGHLLKLAEKAARLGKSFGELLPSSESEEPRNALICYGGNMRDGFGSDTFWFDFWSLGF